MITNDRFAAQLRRHLLETADERPADDQLAAVVQGVARTSQRRPLVARLTWAPGRVGPFPSTALRYGLLLAALLAAVIVGALIGASASPHRSTAFEGTWSVPDPGDGSTMKLYVVGGNTPQVRFEDLYAAGAACESDENKVFRADGVGTVKGSHLDAVFPEGGGCGSTTVPLSGSYDYDSAADTLVDQDGLVWHRLDEVAALPSLTPAPTGAPTPAAAESPGAPEPTAAQATAEPTTCISPPSGATYAGPVGPFVFTASIPRDAAVAWDGLSDHFELFATCGTGREMSIHAVATGAGDPNACVTDPRFDLTTFDGAVAALAAYDGGGIAPQAEITIDGHPAARFDADRLSGCGFGLESGVILGAGESGSIYVIDVDGSVVAIELNVGSGVTEAQLAEARAIVESLTIANSGAATT